MGEIKYVRDLMTVGVATCSPDTSIVDIARLLLAEDLEGIVVMDAEGHAVGVVSRDELVRAYARDEYQHLTAEAIMSERVPQIPPDIPLAAAAQIMLDQRVRLMCLMHHADGIQYPAAVLSYTHLLRHLIAQEGTDLKDLGIRAERESPLASFFKRRDEARRRHLSSDEET